MVRMPTQGSSSSAIMAKLGAGHKILAGRIREGEGTMRAIRSFFAGPPWTLLLRGLFATNYVAWTIEPRRATVTSLKEERS